MFKKILFAVILISVAAKSQTFVKGTLNPAKEYSWIILYQLKGANQLYITNTTITNGSFSLNLPENTSKGMYRLAYDMENGGFVDFIYNNENIELQFNPDNPIETIVFLTSEENKIYSKYLIESINTQYKLDSLQFVLFNLKDPTQKEIVSKHYKESYHSNKKNQEKFEKMSEGKIASHFIKSNKRFNTPEPFFSPQNYYNSVKQHYFKYINFKDKVLLNSTFLSEKALEYVFSLNVSDDMQMQNTLYKNAVKKVMLKAEENNYLKTELLTAFLYTFSQIQNSVLVDYILTNFYAIK